MEELNTRLFSFDELIKKSYIGLLEFTNGLQELIDEFEDMKLYLECEEHNTPEEIEELVYIDSQLRYVYHNLNVAIDALAHYESKSFSMIHESLICLN